MSHDPVKILGKIGLAGFAALTLGHLSQGLTFTAFTPALPQMAQSFSATGHGMDIAQQAVTIAALGIFAGSFVSGKIVDIIGSRRTMLAALILFGISGAGGLVLATPAALLASRVINGFAAACLVTACVNTISLLFEGNARAKAIGITAAMGAAASLIGLLIGGVLAQNFGWRAAFIQFPVFAAGGFVLAFTCIRDIPATAGDDAGSASSSAAYSWADLLPLFMLATIISMIMFMGSTQLAFLLPQDGVTAATAISLVMATITVFAVIIGMNFGWLEQKIGLQGTLALAFAASAAGLGLLGLVHSLAAAFIGAALMGAYVGVASPYPYHAITLKAPPQARARAIGLTGAFTFLGTFINPFVFGPLTKIIGLHGSFCAAGLVMAALAAGALFRRPRLAVLGTAPD
jgi:MFS family permease